ncbi:TLR13 protein, partial [Zapornia atra]|nr:TLR13 protein [Zapornia atra]
LPPSSFTHLPLLLTLDLSHNHLSRLSPGAFQGLGVLGSLDLAHNRLATVGDGAFTGLHNATFSITAGALAPLLNLRRLSLRRARLSSLAPVALAVRPLQALRWLDLCGNTLSTLGPAVALPASLLNLRLCNNSLQGLVGGTAGLFLGVKVLDLSYNNISEVEPFTRLHLHNLSLLLLAGNPLDAFRLLEVADVPPRSLDFTGLHLDTGGVGEVCRLLAGPRLRLLRLNRNGLAVLPDGALSTCPPITTLDLTGNRLRRIGCPGRLLSPRQLRVLVELRVEHNLLRRLPPCVGAPVLPRLTRVSYRFNRILIVGPRAFVDAPRLRLLRLDVNGLAWLHRDAFRGLGQLRELRLDNNLLTDLYPGSFTPLKLLNTLNLRNNRVSVLFPGAFTGLGQLQTLDLGGNNLRHLSAAGLEGLQGLKRLYLDRNRLQEVSAQPFAPVRASLGVLDLRANSLRYISQRELPHPPFQHLQRLYDLKLQAQQPYGLRVIPHRFFQGLTALRALYLAQNRLLAVPPDAFDDLQQLQSLTLADSSGGMGVLPPGVFKNLTELRCLDLENAGLRSLGPEVFGNLSKLERLKLAKNNLQTLERVLDKQLPALRYLDLRKCPLSCGCTNAWLPAWLNNTPVQVVYLYNYTC